MILTQMKIHPWQKKLEISHYKYSSLNSIWTLVMPIYNQGKTIIDILKKIHRNAMHNFDMILINDGSNDETLKNLTNFCNSLKSKKINNIKIINNKTPIFETACDNQGFRLANTEYIIEIQSDIYIEEKDFDNKMICALNQFNLGAVSGRHVHNFSILEKASEKWRKYPFKYIKWDILKIGLQSYGRIGRRIFSRPKKKSSNCFIGETAARGPWLVRKSELQTLNYLDEINFFLGNDDHDYHRRIFESFNKLVGYTPLDIYSREQDGSTRKKRAGINKKIYDHLKEKKRGSKQFNEFIRMYIPYAKIQKMKIDYSK